MAGLAEQSQALRSFAPPSVLPDISPLAHMGGDQAGRLGFANRQRGHKGGGVEAANLPLGHVGEMSGRTEGGAKERCFTERVNSQRHSADCHPGSAP